MSLHVDVLGREAHGSTREAHGVVIVLHAMMVDRRSMDRPRGSGLASTLAAGGWEVWNADFRGHGLSDSVASWSYDDLVMRDVPALVSAARARGGPVWLLGLSLGGHVSLASLAAGATDADGLVGISANSWLREVEPSRSRSALKELGMRAMLHSSRAMGRFPSRLLRVGPVDESLPYIEDLCGYWLDDRWGGRDGSDWRAGLPGVRARVMSVTSRGDWILAHPAAVHGFFGPVPGVTRVVVGRGDCGLEHTPTHMGLGVDPRCRGVWQWMGQWMR